MTAEEKTILACFLNTAEDFVSRGFTRQRAAYTFEDDPLPEAVTSEDGSEVAEPTLPLAYLIDEEEMGAHIPVMVIGASLTEQEDQLLSRMLASIGLYRNKNCYISDIVEDRPVLESHIHRLNPRIILCVGKEAFNSVQPSITNSGTQVIKTFHPVEILRDGSLKRPAFDDMKRLMATLAEIDNDYRNEVTELIKKYAAADPDFASRISSYFRELG